MELHQRIESLLERSGYTYKVATLDGFTYKPSSWLILLDEDAGKYVQLTDIPFKFNQNWARAVESGNELEFLEKEIRTREKHKSHYLDPKNNMYF